MLVRPPRPLTDRTHAPLLALALLTGCGTAKIDFRDSGDDAPAGDRDDTDPVDSGDQTDTDSGSVSDGAISATPDALDYGLVFAGATAALEVTVRNVGEVEVALVAAVEGAWAADFSLSALESPLPGEAATLAVTFAPTTWGAAEASLTIRDTLGTSAVTLALGAAVQEDADADGHGSIASGGDDCDDGDAGAHPGATETWYDGVDQDCLGDDDDDRDADGADYLTDCDEEDPTVYPGATETWYDGVDADCAGDDDFDQDADGTDLGSDCDDTDPSVNPGVTEVWYDGVDQDCDGRDDDQDADGYALADDCDDLDASVSPAATEIWYDGLDQDCSGGSDYDQDADGVEVTTDCDDTDPSRTGPVDESIDGIDNDCDGRVDEVGIDTLASGALFGGSSGLGLGDADGLSLGGDLTGDGEDDLVVSSDASSSGYAWVVSGPTAATAYGAVDGYDTAAITGQSSYYPMGNVVGPMRDLTGDGTADLLIGGAGTSSYTAYGRAWALAGGSALTGALSVSASYTARFEGDSDYDLLGWAASGDIDGDGADDVAAGAAYDSYASSYYAVESQTGNLSVYAGYLSGSYDIGDSDDEIHGSDDYDFLGLTVVVADFDDDGYADILTGAYGSDDGESNGGAMYLFAGNASLSWSTRADDAARARFLGSTASGYLGASPLAAPGDVDGDGSLDLAFASPYAGAAWLFWDAGSLTGSRSVSAADVVLSGTANSFGASLAYASDLDGDGADELWIGDTGDDTSALNAGAVWMFTPGAGLSAAWTSADAAAMVMGSSAGDALGSGLAGGGDADGDGADDLLMGATGADGGASGGGAVYVVRGW